MFLAQTHSLISLSWLGGFHVSRHLIEKSSLPPCVCMHMHMCVCMLTCIHTPVHMFVLECRCTHVMTQRTTSHVRPCLLPCWTQTGPPVHYRVCQASSQAHDLPPVSSPHFARRTHSAFSVGRERMRVPEALAGFRSSLFVRGLCSPELPHPHL